MVGPLDRRVQQGLRRVFEQAGQAATWYRFSGTAAGAPEYGIAGAETYLTGSLQVVLGELTPQERAEAGGQINAAEFALLVREPIGKDDQVRIGTGAQYRVAGNLSTAHLQGVQFYRVLVRRAGAG